MLLRLQGGLGNQLFQLLAMRYLAASRPVEPKKIFINDMHRFPTKRGLAVEVFFENEQVTNTVGWLDQFLFRTKISRLLSKSAIHAVENVGQLQNWKGQCLNGYFQDIYHYPDPERLRQELDRFDQVVQRSDLMPRSVPETDCAIHLRLTDFISDKSGRDFLLNYRLPYIKTAMQKFRDENNVSRFILFSDDPREAKLLLDDPDLILYGESAFAAGGLFKEFCTLCGFHNLVASNSTFSFWAGLLGQTKKIFFPAVWSRQNVREDEAFKHNLRRFGRFTAHQHQVSRL